MDGIPRVDGPSFIGDLRRNRFDQPILIKDRPIHRRSEMDESAQLTYDRFAPIYDAWNSQNDYEMWLGEALLPAIERCGLRKGRALDVGCGTGRAFPPLLARGWQAPGGDVSR